MSRPVARASLLALALFTVTEAGAQTLIVNEANPSQDLSQDQARLYFSLRVRQWPNGMPVQVFVLRDDEPLHQEVVKQVLGLFPYQLRRVWDRQVFSGTGQAPVTVSDEAELIRRVGATPGGIGYAGATPPNPSVRSLEVR